MRGISDLPNFIPPENLRPVIQFWPPKPEKIKKLGKKKRKIYIPDNNQRGNAWSQK